MSSGGSEEGLSWPAAACMSTSVSKTNFTADIQPTQWRMQVGKATGFGSGFPTHSRTEEVEGWRSEGGGR